jgi:hypothetical protein
MLNHGLYSQLSTPECLGIAATYLTIQPFHLGYVSLSILPLLSVQAGKKIVQTQIMKDHETRMMTADLPYGAMKKTVVTHMVETHIAAVQFCPGHMLQPITLHFGAPYYVCIPGGLVCPQYDLGLFLQKGKQPYRVAGDVRLGRRQG